MDQLQNCQDALRPQWEEGMVGEAASGPSPGGQRFEHAVQRISKVQLLSWNISEELCCCMSCSYLDLYQMQASSVILIVFFFSS